MSKPLDALDYLAHPERHAVPGCGVLFGDEAFLKRQVLTAIRAQVLKGEADFSFVELPAATATLRDLRDELATRGLFGSGRRLVLLDEADAFVTRFRAELEPLVARPAGDTTLLLLVHTWPSTTRLYKLAAEHGLQIECKCPGAARLAKWLVSWSRQAYRAELEPAAAEALLEIVEPELGLLDQELAKLAALAGSTAISAELVREAVGGWRTKTTWDLLDAAAQGHARDALVQLERLLLAGETPVGLLAQIASSLRRFAAAAGQIERAEASGRRLSLRDALAAAGVKPFVLAKAEAQLRQIGRARAGLLYRQLLELDLALKGASSAPGRARIALEQLLARLSQAAAPAPPPRAGAHRPASRGVSSR